MLPLAVLVLTAASVPPARSADDPPPQDQVLGSSPDDRQVRVRVVDPDGRPVARVKLWFELDHKDFPAIREGRERRMAVIYTRDDGVASMWYPARPAACVVTARGYAAQFLRNVELIRQDPFVVRLSRGQTIRGRLTRDGGGASGGVVVVATPTMTMGSYDEFQLKGLTDPQGNFELPGAGRWTYDLTARFESDRDAPAYVEPTPVTVADGAAAPPPVELVARPAAAINGVFISAQPVPVGKLRVDVQFTRPGNKHGYWSAETTPDGSFTIHGLPPDARGSVRFPAPRGFVAVIDVPPGLEFLRPEANSANFDKPPPGRHEGLTIRLLRQATATGRVIDEQGQPVAGVALTATPSRHFARSAADGTYELPVRPNVEVRIEVTNNLVDYVPVAKPTSTPSFVVKEGERVTKDIKVERVKDAEPTGGIAGRVVGADGKPAAGARVFLGNTALLPLHMEHMIAARENDAPKPTWQGGMFNPASVAAGPDGRFAFNLLHGGATDLWAETSTGDTAWAAAVKTGAKDVELRLAPYAEHLALAGTVTDPDDKPFGGARVLLFAWGNNPLNGEPGRPLAETKTDRTGGFALQVSPPWQPIRHLRLVCVADGRAAAWTTLPRANLPDLKLRLKPAASVAGRALDAAGKPLAGAVARLFHATDPDCGEMHFQEAMESIAPSATTGPDGRFALAGLARGCTATVALKHPETGRLQLPETSLSQSATDLGDLKLPEGITLEGSVRLAGTGKPAAGATVIVGNWRGRATATADAEGRFRVAGLEESVFADFENYTPVTARLGDDWEGELRVPNRLKPGDRLAGVVVPLSRSFASRTAEWSRQKGGPAPSHFNLAVLHDADPAFGGKPHIDDTLTVYDAAGGVVWQHKGLNVAQSSGAGHALAYSPTDRSLYVAENAGGRLLKFTADGKLTWEQPGVKGQAVAADPKTGDAWVLTSEGTIYGKNLVVYSAAGQKLKEIDAPGFDIVYSPAGDCFWVAGKHLIKVGRDGKVLFKSEQQFSHLAVSADVDTREGWLWVLQRDHPNVAGSADKLFVYTPQGLRARETDVDGACVRVDAEHVKAWVAARDGVQRLNSIAGRVEATAPFHAFSVSPDPGAGGAWAADDESIVRLDGDGRLVAGIRTPGRSQKWMCPVPPG